MKTVTERCSIRDKYDVLDNLWVIRKEVKRVNRIDKSCVVFYHGNFEGVELNSIKRWVNIFTKGLDTTYSPFNNTSNVNVNKKVPP